MRGALLHRFQQYQQERFPLAAYTPLTAVFSFSAVSYSRLLRGEPGFISLPLFLVGVLTALVFFLWLRILDEHKDRETDRRYRPELPVPRGLITLAELRRVGAIALAGVLALNAWIAPVLLWACLAVAGWAGLMTKEFFVGDWLRRRPTLYLISHMLIMPMIDAYSTGLDWLVEGRHPRSGIWLFLVITFLNGTLLEIGRKIRAPEDEREGVDTYTHVWGLRRAPQIWLLVLAAAAVLVGSAAAAIGTAVATGLLLLLLTPLTGYAAIRFLKSPTPRTARGIDRAAGLWTLATYLLLGAGPQIAAIVARVSGT